MNALHTAVVAAAGTGGLQAWIRSNIIPLLLLVIVVGAAPWLVIDRVPAEVLPVAGAAR